MEIADTAGHAAPVQAGKAGAGSRAWFALAILVLLTLVASLDRQVLTLMGEPMRLSLGLSDTQLGVLQGVGISLIAGIGALAVGWAADRHDLRKVLFGILALWGVATVIGGNSHSYGGLFFSAAGMGLLETAMAPIVYAYIPRAFPEQTRALANSVYATLNLLLIGAGIGLAGGVVSAASALGKLGLFPWVGLEPWRAGLMLTAAIGCLCASLIFFLRTHTSIDTRAATTSTAPPPIWPYLRRHRLALVSVFCAFGLASMGLLAVTTWVPVIAERRFGASADEIAGSMASCYLIGIVVGAVGGTLGLPLVQRRIRDAAPLRIMVGGCSTAALACLLLSTASSATHIYLLLGVMVATLIAGVVLAPTMMQDMSDPHFLSRVVALATVVSISITALGTTGVGVLSDMLGTDPGSVLLAASAVGAGALLLAAALLVVGERAYLEAVAAAREVR
jgi:MFS family permease